MNDISSRKRNIVDEEDSSSSDTEIILWTIVGMLVAFIFYKFFNLKNHFENVISDDSSPSTSGSGGGSSSGISLPICTPDITKLNQITTSNTKCCKTGSDFNGDRLFVLENPSGASNSILWRSKATIVQEGFSHQFIISSESTPFSITCKDACLNGILNGVCIGGIGQDDYNTCITLLQPFSFNSTTKTQEPCKGDANPIARKDTELWYAKTWGIQGCSSFDTCEE